MKDPDVIDLLRIELVKQRQIAEAELRTVRQRRAEHAEMNKEKERERRRPWGSVSPC